MELEMEAGAPDCDEARALTRALDEELLELYPEEGSMEAFELGRGDVLGGRGAFLLARAGDEAVGCGALSRRDRTTAELKRMYVLPAFRGRGAGRLLLEALEREAKRLGFSRLVLESGPRQPESLRLYEGFGFVHTAQFRHTDLPSLSVFMEKTVRGRAG